MSLLARQMGREIKPIDLQGLIFGGDRGGDALTAESLALVGGAGLLLLPMLLTASSFLDAPLGPPAVIALGYLAAAHSLHLDEKRRAAVWNFAVQLGLVLWTTLYVLAASGPMSWEAFAALMLAPAFSAAPALARRVLAPRPRSRFAAKLEPARRLDPPDVPGFALERAETLPDKGPPGSAALGEDTTLASVEAVAIPNRSQAESCSLESALTFALRRVAAAVAVKRICLLVDPAPGIRIGCDVRLCRRLFAQLLAGAVEASGAGADIHVEIRPLRGVILLRVTCEDDGRGPSMLDRLAGMLASTGLGELVDQAGGTTLTDLAGQGARMSIRLASPAESPAECLPAVAGV